MTSETAGPSRKLETAAASESQSSTVLHGVNLFFAPQHFDQGRSAILTANAQALGATTTTQRNEATAVIVNPSSDYMRTEELGHKPSGPPLVPYHWIACCQYADRRLEVSELAHAKPVFTHPDRSAGNQPLRVWVSVNIHRNGEANAYDAQKVVTATVEQGGGVTVAKRALADLLVVDFQSKFYQTVFAEHKKAGRDHQRFVERDWVEACVRQEKMKWPARSVAEGEEDSMAEEDTVPEKGKGPGRPTGKPRVDYTPEDDDFLCRYLAAHHPSGSWQSRKTYDNLALSAPTYPIADRHTSQSWHEHFKKNSALLSIRVQRFTQQGVNDTLKTKEERKKAKDMKTAREARENTQEDAGAGGPDGPVEAGGDGGADVGQPLQGDHQTVAQREGARLTEIASKAVEPIIIQTVAESVPTADEAEASDAVAVPAPQPMATKKSTLVDLDSDDEQVTGAAFAAQLPGGSEPATIHTHNAEAGSGGDDLSNSAEAVIPPVLDQVPATAGQSINTEATDAVDVDMNTSGGVADPSATIAKDLAQSNGEGQTRGDPNQEDFVEVFVSTETHVETRVETTTSAITSAQLSSDSALSLSPSNAHPSILASPRSDGRSPKKVRLDLEPSIESILHSPHQRQSEPSESRSSAANAVGRDVHEITRPTHGSETMSPASPRRTTDRSLRANQTSSPVAHQSTPLRRSLVHDNIMSSERKRRRSMDKQRSSVTPSLGSQPDVVLANTVFPPARVQVEPLLPPPPFTGPYLSDNERTEQILAGQRLIQQKKDEYKANIQKFCDRYGLGPGELMALVNEMPKRRAMAGAVYWADVEKGLVEKFGR